MLDESVHALQPLSRDRGRLPWAAWLAGVLNWGKHLISVAKLFHALYALGMTVDSFCR